MKTLQDYEIDEIITLLQELRYRSRDDDSGIVEEIDSVMELLEQENTSNE